VEYPESGRKMPKQRPLRRAVSRWSIYYKLLVGLFAIVVCVCFLATIVHKTIMNGGNTSKVVATNNLRQEVPDILAVAEVAIVADSPKEASVIVPTQQETPRRITVLDILYESGLRSSTNSTASSLFLHPGTGRRNGHYVKIDTLDKLNQYLVETPFESSNAIVGIAANIDERPLGIFIKSARAAMSSVEIFLFLDYPTMTSAVGEKPTPMLLKVLSDHNVHIIEYRLDLLQPEFLRRYHPSSLRWVFYQRFFSNYGAVLSKRFRKVLHTDIRDVQFGANPFRHLEEPAALVDQRPNENIVRKGRLLHYSKEEKTVTDASCYLNTTTIDMVTNRLIESQRRHLPLGCKTNLQLQTQQKQMILSYREEESPLLADCVWNSGWVRDCFGQGLLDVISMSEISCSGVVLGTTPAIYDYFKLFSDTLQGNGILTDRFPQCERNGVDQGVHNVLIHAHLVPGIKFHSAITHPGVVSHMQSDLYVSIDQENPPRILNAQGVPVSIVHQYDRNDALQRTFAQYYLDWIDLNNWHQQWALKSSGCNNYMRLVHLDLLKGQCDFGSFRAISPDMCCRQCKAKQGCTSFTFASGVCWFKKCPASQLAVIYANFTLHVALKLPLEQYVAVADETGTPVSSLVLTALSMEKLKNTPIEYENMIDSLKRGYNIMNKPIQIGNNVETLDTHQLMQNYLSYLPLLEKDFATKVSESRLR